MLFWSTDSSIHGSLCTLVVTNRCSCFRHLLNSISFMCWTSGSAEASRSPLTLLRTSRSPVVGACCFPAISPPTLAADRSVSPLPPNYRPPGNRLLPPTTGGQPVWWSYTSPPGTSSPIESCYCESATESHTPQ